MSNRLGIRDLETKKIVKWPTEYVDGTEFDRGQDPAPNRVDLNKRAFILLLPGQPTFLPFVTREGLLKELNDYEEALKNPEAPKAKSVPDGVSDPDEPPPPEDADGLPHVEPVAAAPVPRRRNQS